MKRAAAESDRETRKIMAQSEQVQDGTLVRGMLALAYANVFAAWSFYAGMLAATAGAYYRPPF